MKNAAVGSRTVVGPLVVDPLTTGAVFLGVVLFVVWRIVVRERLLGDANY